MALKLVEKLNDYLRAPDAALRQHLVEDGQLMEDMQRFFTQATALQSKRSQDAPPAFHSETRLVFVLYMRVLSSLKKAADIEEVDPSGELLKTVLHMTNLVPFCQIFATSNADKVHELLDTLMLKASTFPSLVDELRVVFVKQFQHLHVAVQQAKRAQVLDLLHTIYETSLALGGLFVSPSMTKRLLMNRVDLEEAVTDTDSIIHALVTCYELDLPCLQHQLVTFDEKAQEKLVVIAETRRALLLILGRFFDLLIEKQQNPLQGELLLAVIHAVSHGNSEENGDTGSYLSDLWRLCGYHEKCTAFFETSEMDLEHLSYLEMIVDGLPRRRIIPLDSHSNKKITAKPLSEQKKQEQSKSETKSAANEPVINSTSQNGTEAQAMASLVQQVQEFLPHLGDGYIELCLLSSQQQLETVLNFLLENNPPPALIDVRQDLKRSDPDFQVEQAKLTGSTTDTANAAVSLPKQDKLDPSRVWVGKKAQEKTYDPQITKKDEKLAERLKEIALKYETEDDFVFGRGGGAPGMTLDEYDDDYNDEFEDYEPFGVHDGSQTDDQDTIREQNRRLRAKEEEEAFWESMKNPNHRAIEEGENEEEGDARDEEGKDATKGETEQKAVAPRGSKQQPFRNKKNEHKEGSNNAAPPTAQQIQRERARNAKNKAKKANHNRKERALKKQ